MRADIEALWPGPYCELFARTSAPSWDCWGNEVGKFPAGKALDRDGDWIASQENLP